MEGEKSRSALVTGGSKRIGKEMVQGLVSRGFAVAIHANASVNAAEELAAEIVRNGGRGVAVQADLTDAAQIDAMMQSVGNALGPLDLIVNNASVFADDDAEEFDESNFDTHFAVHVKAPVRIAEHFLRQLPSGQGGLIVNIIDQRVWALNPRFFSYTLSKSTLWTATQTMAQAFAPRGVRVNAIGPGPTLANERQSEKDFRKQTEALLLKRGPDLDEFPRTIAYLYDTPSITGQMIALDGGQHLAWQTPDVTDINE